MELRVGENMRKLTTILVIMSLLAPFVVVGFAPTAVTAQADNPVIVFDMSHGQYSDFVSPDLDTDMKYYLEQKEFEVVWAFGGLNDTILENADALMIGGIYGETNGFTDAEITAVQNWYNEGNKFLWVGSDSDYGGYQYINGNMSAVLQAVGSHVYPEPVSVSDAENNCNASYRVVATQVTTEEMFENITDGVDAVLMHGPTCLYGSTTATAGQSPVDLRDTDITNVYPILYYSDVATIGDSDLVAPYAHDDGDTGDFVAMSAEVAAGSLSANVLIVSGASAYGDYQPMYASEYYEVPLNGYLLVRRTIEWGVELAMSYDVAQPMDMTLILAAVGGAAIIIVAIVVVVKMGGSKE